MLPNFFFLRFFALFHVTDDLERFLKCAGCKNTSLPGLLKYMLTALILLHIQAINSSSGISMHLNSMISANEGLTDIYKFFARKRVGNNMINSKMETLSFV